MQKGMSALPPKADIQRRLGLASASAASSASRSLTARGHDCAPPDPLGHGHSPVADAGDCSHGFSPRRLRSNLDASRSAALPSGAVEPSRVCVDRLGRHAAQALLAANGDATRRHRLEFLVLDRTYGRLGGEVCPSGEWARRLSLAGAAAAPRGSGHHLGLQEAVLLRAAFAVHHLAVRVDLSAEVLCAVKLLQPQASKFQCLLHPLFGIPP